MELVGVADCQNNCAEMSRESSVVVVMLKECKEGESEQRVTKVRRGEKCCGVNSVLRF